MITNLKSISLTLFLLLISILAFSAQPTNIVLHWENPVNAPPGDLLCVYSATNAGSALVTWKPIGQVQTYTLPSGVDAQKVQLWLFSPLRAVTLDTNTMMLATNAAVVVDTITVPRRNSPSEFFVAQYSNYNGTVGPFSNVAGDYWAPASPPLFFK